MKRKNTIVRSGGGLLTRICKQLNSNRKRGGRYLVLSPCDRQ